MNTPNEPNIVVAECALIPCSTVTGAPSPVSLVLSPEPGFVNVGGKWSFTATLVFSDNTTQNVTALATWDSSSLTVASVAAGVATGSNSGLVTITATYAGLQAFSQLTVTAVCQDTGIEITACLGRDAGMNLIENGTRRIVVVGAGVAQLVSMIRTTTDKMAIVSYAGKLTSSAPAIGTPEATTDCKLTNDKVALNGALASYTVRNVVHPAGTRINVIGIGGGLAAAFSEATSGRHVTGQKRVIALVVDGRDVVGTPDPVAVATSIKNAGISLVIIGIAIPPDYASTLRAMASDQNYFGVSSASDCANLLARIPYAFCDGYSFDLPTPPVDGGDGGTVGKSDQTISFDQPDDTNVTGENFDLHANASSALPVTFSVVSGPATLIGSNTVHVTAIGLVTVRASQAGNSVFNPAPNVDRSFWVYADTTAIRVTGYRDGMVGNCPLCQTPSTQPAWDGSFKFVSAMPVSYWISQNTTPTQLSINGKAFFEAVVVPGITNYQFAIYCYQPGADLDRGNPIWIGTGPLVSSNSPVGVYTRTSGCYPIMIGQPQGDPTPATLRIDVL